MSGLIERVRFTPGLLLDADDFRTDQDYHRRMRWLHNRTLHGTGVVTGFDVSIESSVDRVALRVSPGYAIDGLGRELMSDRVVEIAVPGAGELPSSDVLWIVARWAEEAARPVLTSAASGEQFTRLREYALIEVLDAEPRSDGTELLLAVLTRRAGQAIAIDVLPRPVLPPTQSPS